jgi:hypothetical protein
MEEDGAIRARFDGAVRWVGRTRLDVVPHHVHEGEVDLESGHLETEGSLTVRGGVAEGLLVRAGADLHVLGTVDRGRAVAGGGLRVDGSVIGGSGGHVRAGGTVALRRAQRADVRAGGRLDVSADAIDSRLAAREIRVEGRLVGGEAAAETLVAVGRAGSPGGAATVLRAGEPAGEEIEDARAALEDARAIRSARVRARRADAGGAVRGRTGRARRSVESTALRRALERRRRRARCLAEAVVEAGHLLAGVTVTIGSASWRMDEDVRDVRLRLAPEGDEIRTERRPWRASTS